MNRYVAYLLDFILLIILMFVWKPLALLLIYGELFLLLGKHIIMTCVHELYDLSPMIFLECAYFAPHSQFVLMGCLTAMLYSAKLLVVGPSPYHRLMDLWECVTCIGSLSLLCRFIPGKPSNTLLRKHFKLSRMSLTYRIVRHSL